MDHEESDFSLDLIESVQKLNVELSAYTLKCETVSELAEAESLRHEFDAFYYKTLNH